MDIAHATALVTCFGNIQNNEKRARGHPMVYHLGGVAARLQPISKSLHLLPGGVVQLRQLARERLVEAGQLEAVKGVEEISQAHLLPRAKAHRACKAGAQLLANATRGPNPINWRDLAA